MPPDLALSSTLIGPNYSCFELIFMVPKVFRLYLLFTFLNITLCRFRGNFVSCLLYYLARTPQMAAQQSLFQLVLRLNYKVNPCSHLTVVFPPLLLSTSSFSSPRRIIFAKPENLET